MLIFKRGGKLLEKSVARKGVKALEGERITPLTPTF
jgi:hypothetical protein